MFRGSDGSGWLVRDLVLAVLVVMWCGRLAGWGFWWGWGNRSRVEA